MDNLYASITKTSNIIAVQYTDSHTAQLSNVSISAKDTTLQIGDTVSVDLGYDDNHNNIFTGYVKSITLSEPEMVYTINASNVLVRAMDFFIASADPDSPESWRNITAENLVKNVLALAGVTSYSSDVSHFTFAIHNPVEVNLTSAYDYCHFISSLIAFNLYGDKNGVARFENRRPYVVPGDTPISFSLNNENVITSEYMRSEKDIRNRVVVYGASGIHAEAQASSPYLPAGFYKTVVAAAPTVIDSQTMAQQAADYNLDLLNRLTRRIAVQCIGEPSLETRHTITTVLPDLGINEDLYIYGLTHTWGRDGFTSMMELRD